MSQEKPEFIRVISQEEIAASGKLPLAVDPLRAEFGNDFNTLTITNTDAASAINVYLDNHKVAYVTANNGVFSFDWELGLTFNFVTLENTNAGAVIAADKIKVFVGRTGRD